MLLSFLLNWVIGRSPFPDNALYHHKTCLYNVDSLEPHFDIVKLGFTRVYIIIPQQNLFLFWGVYCFHVVRPSVCPSATLAFSKYLENAVMDIHQFLQTL